MVRHPTGYLSLCPHALPAALYWLDAGVFDRADLGVYQAFSDEFPHLCVHGHLLEHVGLHVLLYGRNCHAEA